MQAELRPTGIIASVHTGGHCSEQRNPVSELRAEESSPGPGLVLQGLSAGQQL
jgi:hypothetical protein